MRRLFQNFYFPLFLFALILAVIGLVNLYSATASFDMAQASPYFKAQLLYTILGITVMFVVSLIPLKTLYAAVPYIFGVTLFLLVLVLIFGTKSHGALSWLDLGFVRIQPSEFGKIGLVLILSKYLANTQKDYSLGLRGLIVPTLIFLVPTLLVVMQNDLGSSLFYGFIFGSLILIQGVRFRYILIALLLVVALSVVSYNFFLQTYQKNRIVSFMHPEKDSRGSGYHLVQSKIAVGSGGLWGRGYRKGRSHQLKFLPERHTDFVFPVLAEEWGFIGGGITLLFYLLFLLSGIHLASKAENRFGYFVCVGIVAFYFWHLVINLGGVLGLIPLTGVPLPFLSYGGSSLIANWLAIGFLLSVLKSRTGYDHHKY